MGLQLQQQDRRWWRDCSRTAASGARGLGGSTWDSRQRHRPYRRPCIWSLHPITHLLLRQRQPAQRTLLSVPLLVLVTEIQVVVQTAVVMVVAARGGLSCQSLSVGLCHWLRRAGDQGQSPGEV